MSFWDWFRREELKPGKCECGHIRSFHREGLKQCTLTGRDKHGDVGRCACTVFIATGIDVVSELERIAKL